MSGGLPVITLHPQNQTVGILTGDESVTFTCLAEGEGLLYSWQRQGSQLPLSATTHTLVISGVREEDRGNYQCIVENRFGQVSSDYAVLNVTGKWCLHYCNIITMISTCIVHPPIVTINTSTTIAKVYDSVVLVCSALGFGDLSYAWYFNSSSVLLSDEATFVIDRVLPKQRGEYRCAVTLSQKQLTSSAVATLPLRGSSVH